MLKKEFRKFTEEEAKIHVASWASIIIENKCMASTEWVDSKEDVKRVQKYQKQLLKVIEKWAKNSLEKVS